MDRKKTYILAYSVSEAAIQNLELLKKFLKQLRGAEEGLYGKNHKDRALDYILACYEALSEEFAVLGELIDETYEPYWDSEGNRPTHS